MSLTFSPGPLSGHSPETVNYRIDGPAHKLLMQEFPRRVRATFGGETVFDTTRAMLLHETGLLPQVYVPQDDIRADLLRPDRPPHVLPVQGHRVLLVGDGRRPGRGERDLVLPGSQAIGGTRLRHGDEYVLLMPMMANMLASPAPALCDCRPRERSPTSRPAPAQATAQASLQGRLALRLYSPSAKPDRPTSENP